MNVAWIGAGVVGAALVALTVVLKRRGSSEPLGEQRPSAPPSDGERPAATSPPAANAGDDEVTLTSVTPLSARPADFEDGAPQSEPAAVPLFADPDADLDEPTSEISLLLVSAAGTSDPGRKRTTNEDSFLDVPEKALYAVADGMGGHASGEVASRIAVDTLAEVYRKGAFAGPKYPQLPRRAGELAQAIQQANRRIWDDAVADPRHAGMGTTLVAALFSLHKQRLYIGHVGDSRCYRLRGSTFKQLTADHTLGALGLKGQYADRLARAVGVEPAVTVDLVTARIDGGDTYLLCSDGLSKMASDDEIKAVLLASSTPEEAVAGLVERANAGGGKDNITVIVVRVEQLGG